MRRFFAGDMDLTADAVTLSGDEARHIVRVLRMRPGDELLLISGAGEECSAVIEDCGEDRVSLKIKERSLSSAEPHTNVTLYQCLPKQGKMEVIIQKCVELGVHRIVPVASKRCVVKLDGRDNKLTRWNRVSQEAAKQCGRAFVPEVTAPKKLSELDLSLHEKAVVAYENEGDLQLKAYLRGLESAPRDIAIIIGPEGGFEPSEVEEILNKGGVAVSLGSRILRTETAGMAMLAQIMYELE